MVKDTRSSVKASNEENSNLKGKQNGDKVTTRAGSTTPDTSSLRRSARDTSLKKKIDATPPKSRKSERLDNKPSSTPQDKKKHGTLENQNEVNSVRRSERGKKQSLSTSSRSISKKSVKSSGSTNMKGKKEKKEKSSEQSSHGTREAGKSAKQDMVSTNARSKRMDARAYRALFREKLKKANSSVVVHRERQKIPKRNTHGGSHSCKEDLNENNTCNEKSGELKSKCLKESSTRALEDSKETITKELSSKCLDEPSTRALEGPNETNSKISKEVVENDIALDFQLPSQKSFKEELLTELSNEDSDSVDAVNSATKKLKTLERNNSIPGEKMVDDHTDSVGECKLISLKRKRSMENLDSNALVRNESEKTCSSPARSVQSLSSLSGQSDQVETCGNCLKRQRVDNNSSKDFCSCVEIDQQNGKTFIEMDRGEPMGNVITDPAGNCVWCKLEKASCDIDPNACLICKVGGKLLCCEGKECRRSFHLSCLDPPLDDVPLGVWHCPMCIRRKIKFGVHAVSKGVESVWDTRETEISNADDSLLSVVIFKGCKGRNNIL